MLKNTLLTLIFLVASLVTLNSHAKTELSVTWDLYDFDGYYNIEEKGMPGISLGFGGDTWMTRFNYTRGDFRVGSENRDFQSFRLDLERNFFANSSIFQPYAVLGYSHLEQDWEYPVENETSGALSAGLGMKMNLSTNFSLSADYRTYADDILAQDSSLASFKLTYAFGETKTTKVTHKAYTPAPMPKEVPTWSTEASTILFANNSATLTDTHKALINKLVLDTSVVDIQVEGHASKPASTRYNQLLSEARVQNVVNYIHFMNPRAQVTSSAYGETYATDDEVTSRNVTITVINVTEGD